MAGVRPIIPTVVGYTRTAIALHWVTGVLVLGGMALGVWMVGQPIAPRMLRVFAYHRWIGITVLLLALIRIAWRSTHPPPAPLPLPEWERRAATAVHLALYGLMLLVPLSGWIHTSATGVAIVYLDVVPVPGLVPKDKSIATALKAVHQTLNFALFALVVVHAAAALRHHLVLRNGVLVRMAPFLPRRNDPRA